MWKQSCSECCKDMFVSHWDSTLFPPENLMKAIKDDAEIRRAWKLEKEKKATGLWFFCFSFSCIILPHVVLAFYSFNILFCLSHCSPERQGEWSLRKRRLWNCREVLYRGFIWTSGHAALVHQSRTSDFLVFYFVLDFFFNIPLVKLNQIVTNLYSVTCTLYYIESSLLLSMDLQGFNDYEKTWHCFFHTLFHIYWIICSHATNVVIELETTLVVCTFLISNNQLSNVLF